MPRVIVTLMLISATSLSLAYDTAGALERQITIESTESVGTQSAWEERIEKTALQLSDGRRYLIPLLRGAPIALLSANGETYLMASGADCIECDENIGIRFYLLSGPELKRTNERYAYPGVLFDYMEPERELQRTRVFYGNCIEGEGDSVVWLEEYLGADGDWHQQDSILRLTESGLQLSKLQKDEFSILDRVQNVSECRELAGIKGFVEP